MSRGAGAPPGMRPAKAIGRRGHGMSNLFNLTEASGMSRGAGAPPGMRLAKAIGRRGHGVLILSGVMEAGHA